MKSFDLTLYLVTDRSLAKSGTLEEVVEKAVQGGVTLVQLREKEGDTGELYAKARALKEILAPYHVPLIIDDRIDIMLAVDADGVHVGQSDMPADVARKLIGPGKILGVSAHNLQEAVKAEKDGADYLGVGAMYPTATKKDANVTSKEELEKIRNAVHIPLVAIGGINARTIPSFEENSVDGFAIVSAIMAAKDPKQTAGDLKELIQKTLIK